MTTPTLAPPPALVNAATQTIGVVPQIDGLVQSMQSLPAVSSPSAPSLAADIQKTRQDAATWTTGVRPAVLSTLRGVQQFGAQFDAAYDALQSALSQILAGDSGAIASFQAALAPLQTATRAQIGLVGGVQPQITAYDELMDGDLAALQNDQNQLATAQKNDQAEISTLQQQIGELEHEISEKKKEEIALGILSPLALALEKTIEALTGKQDQAQKQLSSLQSDLAATQGNLTALGGATSTLSSYTSTVEQLAGSAQGLSDGWATLDANLGVLLESEDISTFNGFTSALLAAMKSDWDNLAAQAANLL